MEHLRSDGSGFDHESFEEYAEHSLTHDNLPAFYMYDDDVPNSAIIARMREAKGE